MNKSMKQQMMKWAGAKTEAQFYKLFPANEEGEKAFMAKYGAKIKKAKLGARMDDLPKADWGQSLLNNVGQYQQQYINSGQAGWDNVVNGISNYPYQANPPVGSQNNNGFTTNTNPPIRNNQYTQNMSKELNPANAEKSTPFNSMGAMNVGMKIGQGIESLIEERKQMKKANQWNKVSNIALQASRTLPEEIERDYIRPEDDVIFGEQFNNPYGVGTNVLAKDGKKIKGKKAANGIDFSSFMNAGGNDTFTNLAGKAFDYNAGSQIGGAVGSAVKYIPGVGPVISAIAEPLLTAVGGAIDPYAKKIKKYTNQMNNNINNMSVGNNVRGVQQQYTSYMADGGELPMIQPIMPQFQMEEQQFIPIEQNRVFSPEMIVTKKSLSAREEANRIDEEIKKTTNKAKLRKLQQLKDDVWNYQNREMKNGGRIMDGELKLYDGSAQQISQNPYLPDGGQTIMFNGASHENGGMDISYGNNPVEVEGGEPAVKLEDGGGAENLIVFGNLPIHKDLVPLLGDENAKGKKFKNYIADLSLKENKANKLTEKATTNLADLKTETPMDKLTVNSYKLNMMGADMTLKDTAEKKERAAWLQDAINKTADENGLIADDLAKGKIKKAKTGAKIPKALTGETLFSDEDKQFRTIAKTPGMLDYNPLGSKGTEGYIPYDQYRMKVEKALSDPTITKHLITTLETYYGQDADDVKALLKKQPNYEGKVALIRKLATDTKVGPYHQLFNSAIDLADPNTKLNFDIPQSKIGSPYSLPKSNDIRESSTPEEQEDNKFNWAYAIQNALPYFRPTDAEELDPRQLSGEMYAMATNQLEPVQAQTYQPELSSPYNISLQDQLNANQSDFRSTQRMVGYNPAAQSMLASQKYAANQNVLGEQFRANQAMKDKVYGENRNILNQSKLQNLGILDQQYERQTGAKSNTKAITQAALNSISAKYLQNQLENKTLQTYENMYNYRYGKNMRAQNWNGPVDWNIQGDDFASTNIPAEGRSKTYIEDESGNLKLYDLINKSKKKGSSGRNGAIVSAIKRL